MGTGDKEDWGGGGTDTADTVCRQHIRRQWHEKHNACEELQVTWEKGKNGKKRELEN